MSSSDIHSSACPVDPKAREAWIQAAASQRQQQSPPSSSPSQLPPPTRRSPLGGSCASTQCDESHQQTTPATSRFLQPRFTNTRQPLSHDRQVSSIPRVLPPEAATQAPKSQKPFPPSSMSDSQAPESRTIRSGNWIYPSESQFHNALVRKHGVDAPAVETIPSIIPIHNAVNEQTWKEILKWENELASPNLPTVSTPSAPGTGNDSAFTGDSPKLVSFRGDSSKLTPRARMFGWLGYQQPFDRHDWMVRRHGGEEVEYVIDFYAGKAAPTGRVDRPPLSFYLDVRPKLNSLEGWRMRVWRFVRWQ